MTSNSATDLKIIITCPHSDRTSTPVCWDCAEEGHLSQGGRDSPTSESVVAKTKKRFKILGGGMRDSDQAPEVLRPDEGIEVGYQDPRKVPPGLEVLSGPQVISSTDIYREDEPKSWNTEMEQKVVAAPKAPTILGLRRRVFWPILICLVVVVLIGVAVGAAVGVIQSNRSAKNSAAAQSSIGGGEEVKSSSLSTFSTATQITPTTATSDFMTSTASPTTMSSSITMTNLAATPSSTTTPGTSTSSNPTSSSTPAQSNGYCLGENGSTYTDPGTGAQFRIECDVAHQGKDITNPEAQTMEECVSLCATTSRCKGAIWYNVGPQGTDLNYCWLKSAMNNSDIRSTPDAQSVVLL